MAWLLWYKSQPFSALPITSSPLEALAPPPGQFGSPSLPPHGHKAFLLHLTPGGPPPQA